VEPTLLATLAARTAHREEGDAWVPRRFELARDPHARELAALLASGVVRFVHDTVVDQLRELVAARDPTRTLPADELDRRVSQHLAGSDPRMHGAWVYYPWSARLVHVLPREEHRELRADRNRYKITRDEQRRLATFRVGVIGLSVGNMAAITLALEGVGGSFKLADFDRLSLSNLNRLRAGVHEIAVEKTALAAREMLEIDPYLEIQRYPEGVGPETIDDFLIGGGRLDLLVEECDDLYVKVVVRERARAHRIPVVMDTSDRGLLDIERFDLEPERPIFHGLIGDVHAEALRGLETKDKVPFLLAILDETGISTRMAASLPEIKQTISSWPQLASSVALGGAIVTDIARRILLGEHTESGRYYVDAEQLVTNGAGSLTTPAPPPRAFEVARAAQAPPNLPKEPPPGGELDRASVRWLAAMGTLAPSAHNAQPWKLVFRAGRLECRHDPARDLPTLDFEHGATWLAFGALVENVSIASRHIGREPAVEAFPDPADATLVCAMTFSPAPAETSPLYAHIATRVTNRKRGPRRALPRAAAAALIAACEGAGARLELVESPEALDEMGALMGACDRVSLLNRAIHHDAMHGYRWTPEDVERFADGLDVATMELTASERAGLRLMQQWRTLECLGRIGGGRALEELARKWIEAASAVGLVTVAGTGRESYFRSGRAVQRLWLTAAAHGVALQPMTSLPYLFARLERGGGAGLAEPERRELGALRERYRRLLDAPPECAEALLFRVSIADPPTARSLRRPLDDVLTFA
jgi:molybdopterin/thiamine biosynthesis adenylyltransferase/nitroreductase